MNIKKIGLGLLAIGTTVAIADAITNNGDGMDKVVNGFCDMDLSEADFDADWDDNINEELFFETGEIICDTVMKSKF